MRTVLAFLIGVSVCVEHAHGKDAFQWKASASFDRNEYGAIYQKKESDVQSDWQLRRAKFGMDYRFSKQLSGELDFKVSGYSLSGEDSNKSLGKEVELADANIMWRSLDNSVSLTLGKMKPPMGHERLMSSDHLPAIERTMATSAFTPGRLLGLSVTHKWDTQTISSGVFESEPEEDQINAPKPWSWVTRWTAEQTYRQSLFHVGLSYGYRDLKESLFQLEEKGEVSSADNIIRSARFYADQQETINAELAWQLSKIWLMTEYFHSQVQASDGDVFSYQGFYAQVVYGSSNRYTYQSGRFKARKKVRHDWEIVMRYSGLKLRDNGLGAEAGSLTLGANYYLSPNMTFMVNHLQPSLSGNVVNTHLTGSATSARVRFRF